MGKDREKFESDFEDSTTSKTDQRIPRIKHLMRILYVFYGTVFAVNFDVLY